VCPARVIRLVFESRDGTLEMFPLPVGKGDGASSGQALHAYGNPGHVQSEVLDLDLAQGFVFEEGKIFLLVTLDKEGMPSSTGTVTASWGTNSSSGRARTATTSRAQRVRPSVPTRRAESPSTSSCASKERSGQRPRPSSIAAK